MKLINKHTLTSNYPTSDKTVSGSPLIECGEIAVRCLENDEEIVIVNTNNKLKTFKPHDKVEELVQANKTSVVQNTGTSTEAVMSQNIVTSELTSIRNNYQKNIVTVSSTESSKAIEPNKYYKWGTITSLSITLSTANLNSSLLNEYMFEFTSGSTATTLTLPNSIKWLNGATPKIEANKVYQISIVNNLAIVCSFN